MGDVAPFPHIFSKKVRLFRTWCAFSTHILEKSAPFPHEVRLFHTYFRKMCAFSARGAPFPHVVRFSLYTARGAALRASERSGGKHCAVLVAGLWLSLAFS